jgi:hypothetical protein
MAWKRSLPDVSLDGVEYKSLPSGLHGINSDLVYFVHGQYAGVSAFAQGAADEQHRNASFVAVGALVPLSYGKLGRSWARAAALRRLAQGLIKEPTDTRPLELFWQKHRQGDGDRGATRSPASKRDPLPFGLRRNRGLSDSTHGLRLDAGGAKDHPALYMPGLLDSFGPLLFPLYRAALLRKRILLVSAPPVQRSCSVVFILSVLSSIPQTTAGVLQPDAEPLARAHPLFSVGISDITTLSSQNGKAGWIATTTDDVLGEKPKLWDVVVDVASGEPGTRRRWPKMRTSDGKIIQATQRDLRRYRLLRAELKRMRLARKRYRDSLENQDYGDEVEPLLRSSTVLRDPPSPEEMNSGEAEVVEPVTWTAMAYDSFMWWASAGEEEAWAKEEYNADRKLLDDLPDLHVAMPQPSSDADAEEDELYEAQETATIITAYFHRLTSQIVQTLADVVEEADDETEEGIEEDAIVVTADDVRGMGLDTWSESDKEFVQGMMQLFFGREAAVSEGGLRMCGVRIC